MRVLTQAPVFQALNVSETAHRRLRNSSALLAFALFIIANYSFFCLIQSKPDHDGVIFAINRFHSKFPNSQIVILGSSVAKHVLESISPSDCRQFHLGSLAYNLQMPSDGSILINQILNAPRNGESDCKQVIFCVTPRDLYDRDARSITDTTTFKRLVSIPDCFVYHSAFGLSLEERVKNLFSKLCPFYERRSSFQKRLSDFVVSFFDHAFGRQSAENKRQDPWTRSLAEYSWRYEGLSKSRIELQLSILFQSIASCKKRGQSVILVNLPLSESNLELLPKDFYSQYCALLREQSNSASVNYLDLSTMSLSRADFVDCAHLNGQGGQKVFAQIRPLLITSRAFR